MKFVRMSWLKSSEHSLGQRWVNDEMLYILIDKTVYTYLLVHFIFITI